MQPQRCFFYHLDRGIIQAIMNRYECIAWSPVSGASRWTIRETSLVHPFVLLSWGIFEKLCGCCLCEVYCGENEQTELVKTIEVAEAGARKKMRGSPGAVVEE